MFRNFIQFVCLILICVSFSLNLSLKVLAFGSNKTDSIQIITNLNESSKKINLTYQITQTFAEKSHGIFLVLPKNQNGVWTNYSLKSVVRSANSILENTDSSEMNSEKYAFIQEWSEFRVRIGDKDSFIEPGKYLYEIKIEADYNPNLNYNFTLLSNWVDPVSKIEVTQNNINLCKSEISCKQELTELNLNQNKPNPNFLINFIYQSWLYFLFIIIWVLVFYFAWNKLAKSKYSVSKANSPEFESPLEVYPWEALYLIQNGSVSVKSTLLAYLLWLNNQKIIQIIPDGNPKDSSTKVEIKILSELPKEILPYQFNFAVSKIAEKGMKEGIYSSKINESIASSLFDKIATKLKPYYIKQPLFTTVIYIIGAVTAFVLFILWLGIFALLQPILLIGNSFQGPVFLFGILILAGTIFISLKWTSLTKEGADLANKINRYKYYLKYVEKYKLDYSNNPDEGVQYYLKSVPYAAAFGLLNKFQKYFKGIFPKNEDISTGNLLINSYAASTFYVTPSTSSDSGSSGSSSGGFSGGGGSW